MRSIPRISGVNAWFVENSEAHCGCLSMCGIVGFANNINDSNRVLDECLLKIKHRGPDSDGKYIDDGIALGFRRLSIIDLKSGNQPIFNEDNSKILLFNGEIYNYRVLREELLKCGHKFSTKADSEVLLHGYEEYGTDLLTKLRGMFAFVIWDKHKKELFGARDFFGIKPFYYYHTDTDFIFGSEIKSFLPHPNFNKILSEKALENYLTFQYSVTNDTFFQRVYKLPPAHYFIYKDNKLEISRYWNISFSEFNSKPFDEWVDSIEKTFKNSVSAHKISDVEVGCFLSSGIDSSYVAATADVDKTFTVGFGKDKKYNEISYAEEFSDFIKKENISKIISSEEYWQAFPKIQYHMDEPLADPSAVALYFVSKLASERVKVVLSGEGADEIFAGYNVYSEPNSGIYDKLPYKFRNKISKIASKFPNGKGVNFLVRKGLPVEERFIGNAYIFSESERKKILKISTLAKSPTEITEPYFDKMESKDDVTKMQYLDLNLWLTGDILLKADKMSMANSLELRVPFLDREVMKMACHIPLKYRITRHEKTDKHTPYITKYALRRAAGRDLPKPTAGKKKLGFPVPIRVWLREEKYYNIVKKEFSSGNSVKFFDIEEILRLLDEHKSGKKDNSRKIWTIYTFLIWYKEYFS